MKLIISERADAEVIGHVIILSITILGISMLTVFGVPAIYSLQDMANVKNTEQAFTVLDSRASRVTLGESPLQITNINLGGGTLTVEQNSTENPSYIKINSVSFNITLAMGQIKYTLGDRIVAYESGGVWAQYPGGGSIMLSPPEFHYNGVTLTLPVINISGNASMGGKGTASISLNKMPPIIQFPHPNIVNRSNPVNYTAGKVYVNITSDYYLAWADYAESLGYTKVTTNSSTHSTNIELRIVPSTLGENISVTNPLTFRGLDESDITPFDNFSFKIKPSGTLNWDLRAISGNKKLIFHLKRSGGNYDLNIGYQDDGSGYSDPAEIWEGDNLFTVQPDGYIYIDLLDKNIDLEYDSETVGCTAACIPDKINSGDFNNTDFSWDDLIIKNSPANNKTQSLYNITQHYFWKMGQEGDIIFNQCSTGGGGIDQSSQVLINYTATGALTYLHITENILDAGIS